MITREIMKDWIIEALHSMNGVGWPKDVAKYVWEKYEGDLKRSGGMLYTWQYDLRWAAQLLRRDGILKQVNKRTDKPWELN
ncbi:hypothetical protein [Pantoea sp. SO10]|uniref:hypothetical protein n=1 Tax=Pantoea sp. SO10 TaxID=2575375 RepID=UPI0010C9E868|nr:hypothetical protein [Pantoea sp. SO10]QCP60983.1 hypothetical protein FCN45_17035 [Pantoea sp. SO10]